MWELLYWIVVALIVLALLWGFRERIARYIKSSNDWKEIVVPAIAAILVSYFVIYATHTMLFGSLEAGLGDDIHNIIERIGDLDYFANPRGGVAPPAPTPVGWITNLRFLFLT